MKELVDVGSLFAPALRVLGGGDDSRYNLINEGSRDDAKVIARYVAVPSLANPRALLALNVPPPAWRAALEPHARGAASRPARIIARLLQFTSFLGLSEMLFRDHIALVTSGNTSEFPLHRFLGEVLGRNDFVTNLRIAPGRPNSKPVVQVVSSEGEVLAYAKFGWDGLTRRLIQNETKALNELELRTSGSGLHVPRVLCSRNWNGLEVIVVAPLEVVGTTPWRSTDVPVAASIALVGTRLRTRSRFRDSPFWRRVVGEIERAAPLMDAETGKILLAARAAIEGRWGDVELLNGQSHGDWIPPNISIRRDGAYSVWDWERSESDVPLGLDTLQFILFVELRKRPASTELVRRVELHGRQALLRQNLCPELVLLLAPLSLLRSLLWFGEARLAGRSELEDSRFAQALVLFLAEIQNSTASGSNATGTERPEADPSQPLARSLDDIFGIETPVKGCST